MLLSARGTPVWTLGATIFYAKLFFYMDGHIGDEKEDKPRSQNNRLRELSITELESHGFIQEIAAIF